MRRGRDEVGALFSHHPLGRGPYRPVNLTDVKRTLIGPHFISSGVNLCFCLICQASDAISTTSKADKCAFHMMDMSTKSQSLWRISSSMDVQFEVRSVLEAPPPL